MTNAWILGFEFLSLIINFIAIFEPFIYVLVMLMCDPLLCDMSLFGVPSLEPRLLSPTPSGGAHYTYGSRHGSFSPVQQIVAKQIVGHHVLTSTQFNKEQVMMSHMTSLLIM